MVLSSLIGGGAKPYLEYGWVCAPNTAAQSVTAQTITTLTIDTEVADTGNYGSVASNQVTLAAGTYYFEAHATFNTGTGNTGQFNLALYNNTSSSYVTRGSGMSGSYANGGWCAAIKGQFTIASSSAFSLLFLSALAANVTANGHGGATQFTLATAGADQRTTIKLWKLA